MPTQNQNETEPVRAVARLFAVQLLAVVAIATAITVLVTLLRPDDGTRLAETLPGTAASSTPSDPGAESTPPPASSPAASSPAASSPAETPSAAPTSASESPSPDSTTKRLRVDVLNQSAGSGAAESTAARLQDRGWRVGRVADFTGTVRATTVYYPSNRRGQARLLAKDLPGSPRLLERFSTLSDSRLSVVLVERSPG